MEADDHPEWVVVPYVAPPPPEVESLPRSIPVIEYANTVSTWMGLSYQDFLGRAQSHWAIDPDDMIPSTPGSTGDTCCTPLHGI